VEEKLTATTWKVNGKAEHGFNIKPVHGLHKPSDGGSSQKTRRPKRQSNEDVVLLEKHRRLAGMAWLPRGELLWIS
jgi:hypothetical protein